MTEFLQQIVGGLATGGVYGSLALAIVLIYRSTRVINFAQGEMAAFTTFVAATLIEHGVGYWGAFFLTLAIAFTGGVVLQRVVIRPVQAAPVLTQVILTLGLLILINGATGWIWGSQERNFPSVFSTRSIHLGGVVVSIQDIGIVCVTLGSAVVLGLFYRLTKVGLALRAVAFNPDASRLLGVPVGWMLALGWGLAAMFGSLSGMLAAWPSYDPYFMQGILLYALAAAILGGLDSPLGAVVGGLLLGVVLNLVGRYIPWVGGSLRLAVALVIILAVLLVKPTGLFGRTNARNV
jgi:branched-chain amino acid transport system permease protein